MQGSWRGQAAMSFQGVVSDWQATQERVRTSLDEIQRALYKRALTFREEHTTKVPSYDEFKEAMEGRPGFVIASQARFPAEERNG